MKSFLTIFARSRTNASASSPIHLAQSGERGTKSIPLPTPLTDQEVGRWLQSGPVQKVSAEFARNLERQLYECKRNDGINPVADGKASG